MEISHKHIFVAFLCVSILMFVDLYEINRFMKVLSTCNDDFLVIEKCHCVPCSWEASKIYDTNGFCNIKNFDINISKNG
jgi:hypothetical protein